MKESALDSLHRSAGAEMADIHGWSLPCSYGDPVSERNAVRSGCGVTDLSHRGRIRIAGRDRQTFLQGMVSNDTRLLEEGKGIYATFLEPKGHMRGDMTLYAFPDEYLADTEPGMAAPLVRQLDRFLIREKVTLSVEEDGTALIGVSGPQAHELLKTLLPSLPDLTTPFGCALLEWEESALHVMRRDFTGEESYLLSLPRDQALSLWEALVQAGAIPFGQEALEILRIEAGIPVYGKDMTEEIIPLEAGIYFGINRDKGCYIGQEIIERISSRGHTNRRLVPLRFAPGETPASGAELLHGEKKVGTVTTAALSPELNRPVGLGYVRREAWEPGTELRVLQEGREETTAEVLLRPAFGSGNPPAITNTDPTW